LLNIESEFEENRKQSIVKSAENFSKIKDKLLNQFNDKKQEYDQMCKTQEDELKKRYHDFELKLKVSEATDG